MCTIEDEKGKLLPIDRVEKADQDLARAWILPSDSVLEIGARYGIVSCLINSILEKKTAHVAIEPDDRVWAALEKNKEVNGSSFHIVKGFVSQRKLSLTNFTSAGGFATTSIEDPSSTIPHYSLEEIKEESGISEFTALVVDCEGCFGGFLMENLSLLDSLRIVLFEADGNSKPNYAEIRTMLKQKGFVEKQKGFHNAWIKE
jgi:FkbM family methyltransferase